ncbi:hypothetical protein FDG2_1693 [Candidatus Protofrankia californiensis]|uniref:Uncharacterized protein n=1 Tax=Candidatus Protofrankia californiensis TaxID=1839754 RepID=A0A1C3NW50_9ACTN|nr:hypothetical protein FDG2_1693 [Candidatus Protofrankia californiensis]
MTITDDPRPRCRICDRPIRHPASRALHIGPECLRTMPAAERAAIVRAASLATAKLPVQPILTNAA